MGKINGPWRIPDNMKTGEFAWEKLMLDGDLAHTLAIPVTVPNAADLPDGIIAAATSATCSWVEPTTGNTVITSGVPFKVNGRWVWLRHHTEEGFVGADAIVRCDEMLVLLDAGATPGVLKPAYMIPTAGASQGLVTDAASGNDALGYFTRTETVTNPDTLPAGTYGYIALWP